MPLDARCEHCGAQFRVPVGYSGNDTASFTNVRVTCPACGRDSRINDGTYDAVGRLIAAFTSPGVTKDEVRKLRDVAVAVKTGQLSQDDADDRVAELAGVLAQVWGWANANAGALSLLVSVIALWLSIQANWSNDVAADRQFHATEAIVQELRRQRDADSTLAKPPRPPTASRPATAKAPNRHERRGSIARARRR